MSLCKDWHFLGIKRYSVELLWAGAAFSLLAVLFNVVANSFNEIRKEG